MKVIPLTNRVRGPFCKLRTEFFPPAIYHRRKNEDPLRTEKTRLARYLLYLYCVSEGFGNNFHSCDEERLQISEAGRKQNESI